MSGASISLVRIVGLFAVFHFALFEKISDLEIHLFLRELAVGALLSPAVSAL